MSKFIYWVNTDMLEGQRPVMKSTLAAWKNIQDVSNVQQVNEDGTPLQEDGTPKKKATRKRAAKVAVDKE